MKNPQFILNYDVMYYDTDCGGVVHNLAYLRWVEECRTKMAPDIGIDFIGLIRENRHLALVTTRCTTSAPRSWEIRLKSTPGWKRWKNRVSGASLKSAAMAGSRSA